MFYWICLCDCWSYELLGWLFATKEVDERAYNVTLDAFKHHAILLFEFHGSDEFIETKNTSSKLPKEKKNKSNKATFKPN